MSSQSCCVLCEGAANRCGWTFHGPLLDPKNLDDASRTAEKRTAQVAPNDPLRNLGSEQRRDRVQQLLEKLCLTLSEGAHLHIHFTHSSKSSHVFR